jgi:hypothetical protein
MFALKMRITHIKIVLTKSGLNLSKTLEPSRFDMFLVSWQFLYATHICECFGFQECRAKLKRNMLSERFSLPMNMHI